jgi:23S rRNA pseudouridine2605 synthase
MRIAKALARAGLCSRREAERWIGEGRVSVNGQVLTSPARDVSPSDKVVVDGNPLPSAEPPRLWRYHKPKGLVTSHADPQGRPTVFAALPDTLPRVISVGRLDFNSEGLLLLTNDGGLARHLELPATGWMRRYRVRAHGTVTQEALDKLKGGIEIEGIRYGPIEAALDKAQGSNVWINIGLREGIKLYRGSNRY